jgi:hypothetical protein
MKTNRTITTRVYQAIDGKQFADRNECLAYERKLETVSKIKTALATVFDNADDVYESLVDGLVRMTAEDRKATLNGLLTLTVERKKPVRKTKTETVTEATEVAEDAVA